jgi:hypothetical protein
VRVDALLREEDRAMLVVVCASSRLWQVTFVEACQKRRKGL